MAFSTQATRRVGPRGRTVGVGIPAALMRSPRRTVPPGKVCLKEINQEARGGDGTADSALAIGAGLWRSRGVPGLRPAPAPAHLAPAAEKLAPPGPRGGGGSPGLGGGGEGGARGRKASAGYCGARRGCARDSGGSSTDPLDGCEYFVRGRSPSPRRARPMAPHCPLPAERAT